MILCVQSVDLCSGLSFRCYNFTDCIFPGGDWSELKKSKIYTCPKVSTTHPLPVRHISEAVLLNQEMSYWTFISSIHNKSKCKLKCKSSKKYCFPLVNFVSYNFVIIRSKSVSPYTNWLTKVSETDVVMAPLGSGGVVTVDMGGCVRLWETGLDTLQRSLMEWKNMIGSENDSSMQVR